MENLTPELILPFKCYNSMLIAIAIVDRLYFKTNPDMYQIQKCINSILNTTYSYSDISKFVTRILTYSHIYPINFIREFGKISEQISTFALNEEQGSIQIESPSKKCQICNNSKSCWFKYYVARFERIATLYCRTKIGI